jgi:hypothetical protein
MPQRNDESLVSAMLRPFPAVPTTNTGIGSPFGSVSFGCTSSACEPSRMLASKFTPASGASPAHAAALSERRGESSTSGWCVASGTSCGVTSARSIE